MPTNSQLVSLQPTPQFNLAELVNLATKAVKADSSKRAYTIYLSKMLVGVTSVAQFNRTHVLSYLEQRQSEGASAATCNIIRHAAKKLATEMKYAGLIGRDQCEGIQDIKSIPRNPVRTGRWLTAAQVEKLMSIPDKDSRRGTRDRAILGLLIGCGLRRSEVINLRIKCIQERDGRPVLTDFLAKGNKIRVVALPSGVKRLLDEWLVALAKMADDLPGESYLFTPFNSTSDWIERGNKRLSESTLMFIVRQYSERAGIVISPHDLRRTYARLSRQAGADLEQIQFSLGHANVNTTQRYLGMNQNIKRAPGDLINTDWGGSTK